MVRNTIRLLRTPNENSDDKINNCVYLSLIIDTVGWHTICSVFNLALDSGASDSNLLG